MYEYKKLLPNGQRVQAAQRDQHQAHGLHFRQGGIHIKGPRCQAKGTQSHDTFSALSSKGKN